MRIPLEIACHQSVAGQEFEKLAVGMTAIFSEEQGEGKPRAHTVNVLA